MSEDMSTSISERIIKRMPGDMLEAKRMREEMPKPILEDIWKKEYRKECQKNTRKNLRKILKDLAENIKKIDF